MLYPRNVENFDEVESGFKLLSKLMKHLAEETFYFINSLTGFSSRHLCQSLELGAIYDAYGIRVSRNTEILKLYISPANFPEVKFEVFYQVSAYGHMFGELEPGNPIFPVIYRGRKKIWRILYINRLDKYAG